MLHTKEYRYRYEWQHHGTAHVHGFLWLQNAPDMEKLDWEDNLEVERAQIFFDKYVIAWNPRIISQTNNTTHRSPLDDPCLLNTNEIFSTDASNDYEELINRVQRHTKCTEGTCLHKKGNKIECRYKAPWKEQLISTLLIDIDGKKKYEPERNDDRLNIHNPQIISIWRANIDCQLVIS